MQNNITKILAVGIDPAKNKHKIVGIMFPQEVLFEMECSDTIEHYYRLKQKIISTLQTFSLSEAIIGLEDVSNYGRRLSHFLLSQNFKVKEVNTMITSRQRDSYGEDKNDFKDALSVAVSVLYRANKLPDMVIPSDTEQAIRDLVRYRQQLVKQKTRYINQLHAYISQEYPQYKKLFPNLSSKYALTFFELYPTPDTLKNVSVAQISRLKVAKNSYSNNKIALIAENITSLSEIQNNSLTNQTRKFLISDLARKILDILHSIKKIDKELKKLVSLSKYSNITTFPGINTVTAAKIISETISTQRFSNNRNKYAKYNGTAPVEVQSGNKKFHKKNNRCNHTLKSTYYIIALTAYRTNPISKQFVLNKISKGLSEKQAILSLARRISDIIFAMMQNNTVYDYTKVKKLSIAA